jgi:hypothetical protein
MPNTIDQYREAKATFIKLREQAKKDLLARFHELTNELFGIQKELRDDFGFKISIPAKPKPGRGKKVAAKSAAPPVPVAVEKNDPRVNSLARRLAVQKKKLEDAGKAGKPLKAIQDRVYELEDELRLAREASGNQ